MPLILLIDTTTETATVAIADEYKILAEKHNTQQKDHASFLQAAVKDIANEINISLNTLNAVAVTGGPGSYTGIRVGMSSAKGLAYALKVPLIILNTLEVMALHAIISNNNEDIYYCPMIDARRMEVFSAVFTKELNPVLPPEALIINEDTFSEQLKYNTILFTGNGSDKCSRIIKSINAKFKNIHISTQALQLLALRRYAHNSFENIVSSDAIYIKNFYNL